MSPENPLPFSKYRIITEMFLFYHDQIHHSIGEFKIRFGISL